MDLVPFGCKAQQKKMLNLSSVPRVVQGCHLTDMIIGDVARTKQVLGPSRKKRFQCL